MPDLRATLSAIARGESIRPSRVRGTPVLNPAAVADEGYAAWHHFVHSIQRNAGEPLAAPSATLTPLP